jgi:hypothetical protein
VGPFLPFMKVPCALHVRAAAALPNRNTCRIFFTAAFLFRWALPTATCSTPARAHAPPTSPTCLRGSSRFGARVSVDAARSLIMPLLQDVQARLPLYLEAPTQVTPSLGVPLRHLLPCSVKPPRICFCSLPHHALQDESPNETSWTYVIRAIGASERAASHVARYFKRHFDAYLRGDEFPLPAPAPAPAPSAAV